MINPDRQRGREGKIIPADHIAMIPNTGAQREFCPQIAIGDIIKGEKDDARKKSQQTGQCQSNRKFRREGDF
ncbi:MAG: hypothetical protein WDM76_11155 [Limisphaerales bacterium]